VAARFGKDSRSLRYSVNLGKPSKKTFGVSPSQRASRLRSFHSHRVRPESETQLTFAARLPVKSGPPQQFASHSYTSNPKGLIQFYPVDYVHETKGVAYLDVNADAVRKGDEVPDRPVRITFHKVFDGAITRWKLKLICRRVGAGSRNQGPRSISGHSKGLPMARLAIA
jgi:hypothetical protein